ncbi:Kelch repeat-containing protein [Leptospira interrogans]|uniref:Kelch repeat protein n=1 Tax=Leptospira interrogans serovar Lora str. TE 1992 TaxID=1193028 RepID=M3CTX4_LEPIR|nr:kelch repeat-containing protein [Leptospira interrogans]EMF45069.1 kelch repeat protein [Leptospira interrogans serovar Lora str. TE 1992]AKH78502.1 kelch repeat protein [Leptospira interrogans serovar Bratislava]EJP18227.1 kelch repeat protein [Leptospira interrogans str. FPW2026]EKO88195.1 kelch repeat protein [Leptospira interrogans serovar Grippotyphosa str. Andaman]EKP87827.1 kelch repeat protein [Leptospira interrogans serovar Grippotyphosa str. 2006006986]
MFRKISIIIISLLLFTVCQKSESEDQNDLSVFGLISATPVGANTSSNPSRGGGSNQDPFATGEISQLTNPNIPIPACANNGETWTQIPQFGDDVGSLGSSKVDLANGSIRSIGGYTTSLDGLAAGSQMVSEFNPAFQQWNSTPPDMGAARAWHTATLLNNDKIIITGGYGWDENAEDFVSRSSIELFDLNNLNPQWTYGSNMQIARMRHRSNLLPNGDLLVHGDIQNIDLTKGAEIYNPNTNTWSFTNPVNFLRAAPISVLLQDGRVFVAGGFGPSKTAEIYDPATNSWTVVAEMNKPRVDHSSVLLANGKVLVAGGSNPVGNQFHSDMEIYDPNTNQWTTFEMPVSRMNFTMDLLGDGSVLFLAGRNDAYVVHNLRYFPNTDTWCRMPDLQHKRYGHQSSILPNGNIFVFGGSGPNNGLEGSELFQ